MTHRCPAEDYLSPPIATWLAVPGVGRGNIIPDPTNKKLGCVTCFGQSAAK